MTPAPPYSMLAELTHRCPLRCPYCSNPLQLKAQAEELTTGEWLAVLDQAAALGVVQLGLSGGEPLLRDDLEMLVSRARHLGIYSNLITSGLGLTEARARELADRGLNSIQLSIQADEPGLGDRIAGRKAHSHKVAAADAIRAAGLPLSMNLVVHRLNVDRLGEMIDLCAEWGAEELELANTQYYGWALRNQTELMPSREQLARADVVFQAKKAELAGALELVWVVPDYHEELPKPCMGGWGRISLTVGPSGLALPCPAAESIAGLRFDSVRERDLAWIWASSAAFNAYRGFDWMAEPCRSCPRREIDFGGCRCQAFALTGDARRTDPVCKLSPDHGLVGAAVTNADRRTAADAVVVPAELRRLTYRQSTVH